MKIKRLISLLLSATLFISIITISPTVFATAGSDNSPLFIKINKAEQLENTYGEDLLTEVGETISWNFNDLDDIDNSYKISDDNSGGTRWGNTQNPSVPAQNHAYGTHGYIIKKANDESESGNRVSDRYITLVYEISKRCDTEYGSGLDDFCSAFHGNGNYIANLVYLWRLTRLIGANKNSVTNPTDTNIKAFISQMANQAYNNVPQSNLSNDAQEKLDGLHYTTPKVLKKYFKTNSIAPYSGQTWAGRCKYILYGIISHMVGDVFAHRVLLKTNAANYLIDDNITFDSSKMLDRAFFTNTYFRRNDLINDVTSGTVPLNQLKNYVRTTLAPNTFNEKQRLSHKNYADNPLFYSKRINEAICALSFFFDTYLDVSSVSQIIDYSDTCFTPVEGFTLRNFEAYENQLGIQ